MEKKESGSEEKGDRRSSGELKIKESLQWGERITREVGRVRVDCVWNPEDKKHKCVEIRWNFDSYKLSQLVLKGGGGKQKDNRDSIEPKRSCGNWHVPMGLRHGN